MGFSKEELFALPVKEKIALIEELWESIENDKDIAFAEERLKVYQANPNEGVSLEELKSYFSKKYGF